MRAVSRDMPNVTPVLVRDQIETVSNSLEKLGTATRWGALAVLLTGLAVLIGTAAAGEERRTSEAAILKVLGRVAPVDSGKFRATRRLDRGNRRDRGFVLGIGLGMVGDELCLRDAVQPAAGQHGRDHPGRRRG